MAVVSSLNTAGYIRGLEVEFHESYLRRLAHDYAKVLLAAAELLRIFEERSKKVSPRCRNENIKPRRADYDY